MFAVTNAINRTLGYQVKIRHFVQLFILFFRAVSGFEKCKISLKNAQKNVQKLSLCINCVLRSLWKYLKTNKWSQGFSTICSLWTMHQIILHDFTSGGCKMALHNTVPQGTTQGGGGALKLFFDGGVPHETLKWGSKERTKTTKYMDFEATKDLWKPSNGGPRSWLELQSPGSLELWGCKARLEL